MKKTLLLTGGTGKFGKILTKHFIEKDWIVVTTSRNKNKIEQMISDLGANNGEITGLICDFRESGAIKNLVNELSETGITISHLINNARSIETLAVDGSGITAKKNFLGEFELNAYVPYELSMRLIDSGKHNLRSIVNISSMYGCVAPNPYLYGGTLSQSPIQYGISKAALNHLTRELSVRLAPVGVRVNSVAFGGVEGRADKKFTQRYAKLVPSQRMLEGPEIIGPVEFLLTESSSAVNGHILVADAGWSVW